MNIESEYLDDDEHAAAKAARTQHIADLRAGADALRMGELVIDHSDLILRVAAWIDAEAATLELTPVFADAINSVVKSAGGPDSFIRFGRTPDGKSYAMSSDTSSHAVHIINASAPE